MSTVDKSPRKPLLSVQLIVLIGIVWAVAALLFFLSFSVTPPGQSHPLWYAIGTLVFEALSYLAAALLCFRNWRSPQIVSGRNVWLGIGLGMASYFIGNLIFGYWENGLGQDPEISPADFFFILTYIFLGWGMASAVFNRRLNLEIWQWGVVAVIAIAGIAIATTLSIDNSKRADALLFPPAIAQTASPTAKPSAKPTAKPAPPAQAAPATPMAPVAPSGKKPVAVEQKAPPPEWVVSIEKLLEPLAGPVKLFYLVCDVLLLILAAMLLLAFWGGRFSQSWRVIAAAAFCLYIADTSFNYATRHDPNYQSGGLLEVFWVFSGVLFTIGAALEHDLSSRARSRTSSRRRAS